MPRMKLTDAAVKRIKPPKDGQIDYFDSTFPGLALRVGKTGRKAWASFYRVDGKLRRDTLGTYPSLSLADARKKARGRLDIVEAGGDPKLLQESVRAEQAEKRKNTMRAVVDTFIERYAKPRNRSWGETKRLFDNEVMPGWGDRPIGTITRRDVHELMDAIMDSGRPYVANRAFAALRKLFNWAIERGYLETSPCDRLKPPATEEKRDRVLSDDEFRAVWKASGTSGEPFGSLIRTLFVTGQRLEEVATMKIDDVSFDDAVWRLPKEATKGKRAHWVPLSPLAVEILGARPIVADKDDETVPKHGPYLFSTRHGHKPAAGFSKWKAAIDKASGVTGWRLHDIRRTIATQLASLGVSSDVIGRVLNHAPKGVTAEVYMWHDFMPEKRRALNGLGRLISLMADDYIWPKAAKLLRSPAADSESAAEMRRLILDANSETWARYVESLARPDDVKNVITLNDAKKAS